jgi:hypothetical protein
MSLKVYEMPPKKGAPAPSFGTGNFKGDYTYIHTYIHIYIYISIHRHPEVSANAAKAEGDNYMII